MKKWILIIVGLVIFAGVLIPVDASQSDTEFRLAGHARDACYADAGYSRDSLGARPADLVRTCTQPIRDWEARWPLRTGLAALAGLLAVLVYALIVLAARRMFFAGDREPAEA